MRGGDQNKPLLTTTYILKTNQFQITKRGFFPRLREGCGGKCSDCGKIFSYWDDLQLSFYDEKLKCANCKGIEIDLIKK